jgi:3-phenylpropionate/cinnamic acid dioxygenase small subunit
MPALSIEDRLMIDDLFVRYTCALDAGDVDTLVGCFAEDGSLESPAVGKYTGRPAIREFAARFARFRERGSQMRHVISNLRIEVDGDRGSAKCYLVVFLTRDGKSRMLAPGTYDCTLAKVDGQWLFQRRIVTMDHDYELEGI